MALKAILTALTDVPELLRGEYEQRDGKFHLKLEGVPVGFVPEAEHSTMRNQHAEFRDNNRALNTKVTELEAKLRTFDGIDPTKHAELVAKVAALEKKGVKDSDDLGTVVQNAVNSAVGPIQAELKALKESEAAARVALARKGLETVLTQAGITHGVEEHALSDFLRRGLEVFAVDGDKHVAKKADGTPLYKDGAPMTPEGWAIGLRAEAPHLFKPSKGGGTAPGPGAGGGPAGVRTIPAGSRLTQQDLTDIANGKAVREAAA
jgi:hypothetical protein